MDIVQVHGHSLDSAYSVTQIQPPQLRHVWPGVYRYLVYGRKYLEEHMSLEDVYASVYSGALQMWLGVYQNQIESVGLTQIMNYPLCRSLRFVWIGGSGFRHYRQYGDWIELWARRNGCSKIEVLGRPGWMKMLEGQGYEPKAVLLEKDISNIVEM